VLPHCLLNADQVQVLQCCLHTKRADAAASPAHTLPDLQLPQRPGSRGGHALCKCIMQTWAASAFSDLPQLQSGLLDCCVCVVSRWGFPPPVTNPKKPWATQPSPYSAPPAASPEPMP
jgi:hypothetical protein